MARPLRLELAGGLYHITSRGDGREDIYRTDANRNTWLTVLGLVCQRFNWVCHAWCQMDNHYHLLIETPEANLSKGMKAGVRSFIITSHACKPGVYHRIHTTSSGLARRRFRVEPVTANLQKLAWRVAGWKPREILAESRWPRE